MEFQVSSMESHLPSLPPLPIFSTETSSRRSNTGRAKSTVPLAPPYLCLDANNEKGQNIARITPPPSKIRSPLHLRDPSDNVYLCDLLLLSPSPVRKSRFRCLHVDLENVDPVLAPRRRNNTRKLAADMGLMRCASPRNGRRSRQQMQKDEKEYGLFADHLGKVRRRKQTSRPSVNRKGRPTSVTLVRCSDPSPSKKEISNTEDSSRSSDLQGVWNLISDLVMWNDVARSSLWFGFGSLCFFSSFFSNNINFNLTSVVSHLCLFILATAFCYDSFRQRCTQQRQQMHQIQLTGEDILRVTNAMLPKLNALIAITQEVFSGEPSMTLKVAPVLLFTAKYGHVITLWRFLAFGFFISFTAPKLYYSCYSERMRTITASMKSHVCETWKACQHKKIAAFTAATMIWNMFDFKARIITVFASAVIIRYHRKLRQQQQEEDASEVILLKEEEGHKKALAATEQTEKQEP